jgi:hypothetical protein
MKKINSLLVAGILLTATVVNAQKWNKPLTDLKGQTTLNLKYTYDGLVVGKDGPEADYLSRKKADISKKDPAKAEAFEKGWYNARPSNYYPKFETLLNKGLEKVGITAGQNQNNAKYTMVVNTTFIEPGFNVGVMKKPASCNFDIKIVETANPSNVISQTFVNNVPGSQYGGYDFDATTRIAECYAKAAKMVSKTMAKGIKK